MLLQDIINRQLRPGRPGRVAGRASARFHFGGTLNVTMLRVKGPRGGGTLCCVPLEAAGPPRAHRRPPQGVDFDDLRMGRTPRIVEGAL